MRSTREATTGGFDARRADVVSGSHPEQDVEDVRSAVAEATARLELVVGVRPATLTVGAHQDADATLHELTKILNL